MTTLTCNAFRAIPIAGGQIRLEIEGSTPDAIEERMSLQEIATALKKSVKQVDKLSRRAKRPLPLIRGNGRPYALRYQLDGWLKTGGNSASKHIFPSTMVGLPEPTHSGTCRCGSNWTAGPGSCYCPDCQP